jgi:hypothetical protein
MTTNQLEPETPERRGKRLFANGYPRPLNDALAAKAYDTERDYYRQWIEREQQEVEAL